MKMRMRLKKMRSKMVMKKKINCHQVINFSFYLKKNIIKFNNLLYYEFLGYINYIGDFKNGRKNGLGLEYDKFGNILHEGKFEDGEFCPENS